MQMVPNRGPALGRRRFLGLAGVTALVPFVKMPGAAAAAADPIRVVLPNGLTVLIEERPTADTVAMQLTARAGSRDDENQPGITIMTSRMMFQGTSRYPSETELQRAAQLVGGSLSRGTTVESSIFAAVVPSREVDVAFDLLSSLVLDPLFDEGALARQKTITLQDLAERHSTPSSAVEDLFNASLFGTHPLSRPVIGTEAGIASVTRDGLLAAHARQWGAANLVLTIVGRLNVEETLANVEAYFGPLPSGTRNDRVPATPAALQASRTVRGEAGQQQVQFRVGYVAPDLQSADRYPMVLLTALMSGGSGRLFRELRGARGLAYFAGAGYPTYTDAGAWYATANVDPQNVQLAVSIVREEIRKMGAAPPAIEEVLGTVSQIAGRQILADETNSARSSRLAAREVLGQESTEEFVQRMREVTPADVQRVAQRYLDPDRALIAIVGPPVN
jgi:predicted Zn-dependent peptidase